MAVYLVSYDLRAPGRSYEPLYARLRTYTHAKALESVWLVDSTQTAATIRDYLTAVLDTNDRLLVVALSGPSAWKSSLMAGAAMFLQSRFGAA